MEDCKVNLQHCTYLVIDEADRMLTMGLGKQLRIICNYIRPDRQTFVALASRTKDTQQLIEDMTKDPVIITVGAATLEDQNQRPLVFTGKKTELEQKWSLDALRSGRAAILVATDVAARNVDSTNVRFVISYDYPSNPGEYPRRLKHASPVRRDGSDVHVPENRRLHACQRDDQVLPADQPGHTAAAA
ncbi:hypothetical protein MTO96_040017 [Rhipicephalus appendiculatus]